MQSTNAEFSHAVISSSVRLILPCCSQHEAGTSSAGNRVCRNTRRNQLCRTAHAFLLPRLRSALLNLRCQQAGLVRRGLIQRARPITEGNVYAILDLPERSVARSRARPGRHRRHHRAGRARGPVRLRRRLPDRAPLHRLQHLRQPVHLRRVPGAAAPERARGAVGRGASALEPDELRRGGQHTRPAHPRPVRDRRRHRRVAAGVHGPRPRPGAARCPHGGGHRHRPGGDGQGRGRPGAAVLDTALGRCADQADHAELVHQTASPLRAGVAVRRGDREHRRAGAGR